MLKNRKLFLSLITGIIFSGTAIWVSFRNVPAADLIGYMRTIDLLTVTLSILIGISSYFVRALRWKVILDPIRKIGFWHAYHPLAIAFMINCILPGRVGELARPAILYKRDGIAFSKGIATVAVERIFDFITLLSLFVLIMGAVDVDSSLSLMFNGTSINKGTLITIRTKIMLAGMVLIGMVVMLMLSTTRRAIGSVISGLPRLLFFTPALFRQRLSDRIGVKSHAILDNIALGFEVLRSPRKILSCILLSLCVWLITFSALYLVVLGANGASVSFLQASAVVIFICFFIMLPSVPGFWGIWEAGGIYGLMLFGVPKVEAAGLTLTFHVIQIIPLILLGLFSAWIIGVNIVHAGPHPEKVPEKTEQIEGLGSGHPRV